MAADDRRKHEPALDDLSARLERERASADAKYNDTLSAVDAAITRDMPTMPVLPTESGIHPAATRALVELIERQTTARMRFESRVVQFLQQITPFVESKERAIGGPEIKTQLAQSRQRQAELQRALDALRAEASTLRAETSTLRADSSALRAEVDELKAGATEAAAFAGSAPLLDAPPAEERTQPSTPPPHVATPLAADASTGLNLGEGAYVGFEDQFRGSREEIARRLEDYMPIFFGASNVLDIGCGRGELLDLFRTRGISARGVDLNAAMAAECRARGLDATAGDAISYLDAQPDGSLGGVIAIQVVEHLDPRTLIRLLAAAFLKMAPGAPLVLETINAACWMAFFETYIRDLTHARPLHPDTLKFLVESAGFTNVDIRFRSAVTDSDRLPRVDIAHHISDPQLVELAATLNAHADKLNERLFSSMDFAIVARR